MREKVQTILGFWIFGNIISQMRELLFDKLILEAFQKDEPEKEPRVDKQVKEVFENTLMDFIDEAPHRIQHFSGVQGSKFGDSTAFECHLKSWRIGKKPSLDYYDRA